MGLCACSNSLTEDLADTINELEYSLYDMGLNAVSDASLYEDLSPRDKAAKLNGLFANPDIKAVFDVSGGDAANEVLPYIDYELMAENDKIFYGYSDLTAVINATYTKCGKAGCLYNVRNLIYEHRERQMADFEMTVIGGEDDLLDFDYDFVRGDYMKGVVIGGNIRCFLKLAGTEYMPSFRHRILFLESRSGDEARIRSYFNQLAQMGAFKEVSGVLLGTFLELEREDRISAAGILKEVWPDEDLPVAVTGELGHRADSKAIYIGKEIVLE